MPIRRDLSNLPAPRQAKATGWAPDPEPQFGQLLVEALYDKSEPRDRARPEARFRHSDAAACSRAVAYAALDLEPTNPMDQAGTFVTQQGHTLHELWQDEMEAQYGDQVEVEVVCGEGEFAGHIDAVVTDYDTGRDIEKVIAIEAKSVGGYAYQSAVGARGTPEGPRWSAVVQASLNGLAVDADEVKIIYWGRDAISIQTAERKGIPEMARVCAEWTLTREEYEPIALREKARVTAILLMVDEATLPARKIPDPALPARHLVVDPRDGSWVERNQEGLVVDTGATWHCAYCRWQDMCSMTPAERTPLADLKIHLSKEEDDGRRPEDEPAGGSAPGQS